MTGTFQSWYGRHKLLVWTVAGLAMLYTLAGFVVTPLVIHHLLKTKVSQQINRPIKAGTVRTNPFTFTMRLTELAIAERDGGAFVDVKTLALNAQPLMSLFKWGVVIKSVEIEAPSIRVVRSGADQFNFSDLMTAAPEAQKEPSTEPVSLPRLVLDHFKIEQGRIDYVDKAAAEPFQSTLSSIQVAIKYLDTQAEAGPAQVQFSALSEAEERMQAEVQVDIEPLVVAATFAAEHIRMPKYAPYYGPLINARIEKGLFGVAGTVHWSKDRQSLEDLACTLRELTITTESSEQAAINIPEFGMIGAEVDLIQNSVQLGRVESRNGSIHVARSAAGDINLVTAFLPPTIEAATATNTPSADAKEPSPTWIVTLPELNLDGYAIQFKDEQVTPPADLSIAPLEVQASDLTTQQGEQGSVTVNLTWGEQGSIDIDGQLGLNPPVARLDVQAGSLDIRPLQPYIGQFVHLVVTQGAIDTTGELRIAAKESELGVSYSGQAALNRFQSVDAKQGGDFLKWKSLFFEGIDLAISPLRLHIKEVALTDFFNRLIIFGDGTSNVVGLVRGDPVEADTEALDEKTAAAPTDASDGEAPDIQINTVTLQGGTIDFSDQYIKPNVRLPMTAVGGRVSGLDAIQTHRADVLLRGMVNETVPMEIKGKINPLIEAPYVDLKLDFTGIDLSPFTPYSGKYLGYTLDKGQLSLNLSYLVADNKLSGQNKVLLNQLTLGQSVPSESATKLPIKFAIALLKDSEGKINLDLPVSGDMNDPEFSIGGIIGKMIVNLIVSIVTSPFKVLGALFGGGEELSYLDFEPGGGQLPEEGHPKLDTLAKILTERPGLNLEIQGQVHPEKDMDALRLMRFDQELKTVKLNAMAAAGQQAVPLEQIELTPQERDTLIEKAYVDAEFPKPRDASGKLKVLQPAEMEKLLYTAIVLSEDDLRLLAHQRATAAKTYLLETAGLDASRLFVVEPKLRADDQDESMQSRVQFNLK